MSHRRLPNRHRLQLQNQLQSPARNQSGGAKESCEGAERWLIYKILRPLQLKHADCRCVLRLVERLC
eukprot:g21595.t1